MAKSLIPSSAIAFAMTAGSAMALDGDADETAEADPYAPETIRCERVAVTG